ncbi:MAG: deoxyribose-phosphate aldolase [Dictyoglomi bacterium]|jgi:deoxyribose-phosphate aldolase|nr:deoxyribose-phosphate aldolase [Dictyoglomota bacterium]HHV80951.1 deoxyribose-phosphate aldolase [bacterium]
MTRDELLKYIDQTLLKPQATIEELYSFLREAKDYKFYAVCINPWFTGLAVEEMRGTGIKTGIAIGFPLGATTTRTKLYEAEEALDNGADELDMVINIGALKSSDFEYVESEIKKMVNLASGKVVKVILETCYLTDEEKISACKIAMSAGASFVKTSTGFGPGGATVEDVRLMRQIVGDKLGVKASGGIRTLESALKMIEAGANRIGTSSGKAIIDALI